MKLWIKYRSLVRNSMRTVGIAGKDTHECSLSVIIVSFRTALPLQWFLSFKNIKCNSFKTMNKVSSNKGSFFYVKILPFYYTILVCNVAELVLYWLRISSSTSLTIRVNKYTNKGIKNISKCSNVLMFSYY